MDPPNDWWIDTTPPCDPPEAPPFQWKSFISVWERAFGKMSFVPARRDDNVKPFGIEFVFTHTEKKHPREDTTKFYPTSTRPWEKVPVRQSQDYTKTRRRYRR